MAVTVVIKVCGGEIPGKFASIDGGTVTLFSGAKPDGKGGHVGCGKKLTFSGAEVEVLADNPEVEVRYGPPVGRRSLLRRLFPGHRSSLGSG